MFLNEDIRQFQNSLSIFLNLIDSLADIIRKSTDVPRVFLFQPLDGICKYYQEGS